MLSKSTLSALTSALVLSLAGLSLGACSASSAGSDSEELVAASETEQAVTGQLAVGSELRATTNVNLRSGPSTGYRVLHVVATGAHVKVVDGSPQNGFYKVDHAGTVGFSYGIYYAQVSAPAPSNPPSGGSAGSSRSNAIARAKAGVGFSYHWGHGSWLAQGPSSATAGSCSGSCPSCSHSGRYGADCSGFVAKVWAVPSSNADLASDQHPYSTVNFDNETTHWQPISRSNLVQADALVYNSGGSGHVVLYSSGDGWGSMYTYECRGCAAGCVYNLRTASSAYKAIRRDGW